MARNRSDHTRTSRAAQGHAIGPRVVDTARLAAEEGLSNREIAARRHCSVHTVNNQLRAFYDFAKGAAPDAELWARLRTSAQLRQALPEIWRRVRPALIARGFDLGPEVRTRARPDAAGQHDLPAARCRRLWGREQLFGELLARLPEPRSARIVLLAVVGGYGKIELARALA